MVEIVNIVATGDLGQTCDLHKLSTQIQDLETQYEPEVFPGLQIRIDPTNAIMTIFSSGKYTITGVTSESDLESVVNTVSKEINRNSSGEIGVNKSPEIKNIVCKSDIGRELDLSNLTIGLGAENTEYNPKNSAFVYYRPEHVDCLITISSNGSVSITGVQNKETAERAFDLLKKKITQLFDDGGC